MITTDIRSLKTIQIHRGASYDSSLDEFGFTDCEHSPAVYDEPYFNGISKAHIAAINAGIATGGQFIVLEEDVWPTDKNFIIEYPEDADAVYLGHSDWGVVGDAILMGSVRVSEMTPNIYRVFNMLAAHGVLYLNKEYAKAVVEATSKAIEEQKPHDVLLVECQERFKVYVNRKPIFFQRGGNEKSTAGLFKDS